MRRLSRGGREIVAHLPVERARTTRLDEEMKKRKEKKGEECARNS